ncbi:MAG: hypothetical protein GXP13_05390 [Gammaproteobacteria bacterium]|nr:hypothetical protein [Gammaproteobacteria bacterium]
MRRLLIFQVISALLVAGILASAVSPLAAKAGLFGGIIVLLNTGLMMMHNKRAAQQSDQDAQVILKYVYLCAAERLILTLILFAIGLLALKLLPLYLFLGFIAGQLAAFLNGIGH